MIDIKSLNVALEQLSQERGIVREELIGVVERAIASAYKREYGNPGQIVVSKLDEQTGSFTFQQHKVIVDESSLLKEDEERVGDEDTRVRFNPERHIMIEDAKKINAKAVAGEDIVFPLETREGFGRIATQTAKQVVFQKLRDAERKVVIEEFSTKEGSIVVGSVRRIEGRNIYVDLGRTIALLPDREQIPGERFQPGERIRAYVIQVNEQSIGGSFIVLSRAHPQFVVKLFEQEVPELTSGVLVIEKIARAPGMRTKIAIKSTDDAVDPVGALVGPRGVRVFAVRNEIHKEQIDIADYSDDLAEFIEEALLPASVKKIDIEGNEANIYLDQDDISLAIGRGGKNILLASELTGCDLWYYHSETEELIASVIGGELTINKPLEDTRKEKEDAPVEDVENESEEVTPIENEESNNEEATPPQNETTKDEVSKES